MNGFTLPTVDKLPSSYGEDVTKHHVAPPELRGRWCFYEDKTTSKTYNAIAYIYSDGKRCQLVYELDYLNGNELKSEAFIETLRLIENSLDNNCPDVKIADPRSNHHPIAGPLSKLDTVVVQKLAETLEVSEIIELHRAGVV